MVAATGVGAGDIVMASLAGARYGLILLWAAIIGGLLKYILHESLAKWDIATGTLITYTGVVTNTLFPLGFSDNVSTTIWGGIHSFGSCWADLCRRLSLGRNIYEILLEKVL